MAGMKLDGKGAICVVFRRMTADFAHAVIARFDTFHPPLTASFFFCAPSKPPHGSRHVGLDLREAQRVQLHDYNIVVEAALDDPRIGWWLVTRKGKLDGAASAFRSWIMQTAQQDPLV
jgi:hypothetical protein